MNPLSEGAADGATRLPPLPTAGAASGGSRATILWQRLDGAGHEAAELVAARGGRVLRGAAVFAHDGRPCQLVYSIACDAAWRTTRAAISGHVGGVAVSLDLARSGADEWRVGGAARPDLTGCVDVDLAFSPATNLLPIRRLALRVGERATVRAAWLRFPELTAEPFEQVYSRSAPRAYAFQSADGVFRRDLLVDGTGFVLDYPDFWRAVARAGELEPIA